MPDETLIQHCAPTLAGIKTGSLFSHNFTSEKALREELREHNRVLRGAGLRILPLKKLPNGRILVYVYRPGMLERDLAKPEQWAILKRCGYTRTNESYCINLLRKHLNEGDAFPHEIGLFLGYPPEDVQGFIDHQGKDCLYTGTWKVYGNLEKSLATFRRYESCTKTLLEAGRRGMGLSHLAVKTERICG